MTLQPQTTALASRFMSAPEGAESPPSATDEEVYCQTLLDSVEAAFNEIDELESSLIFIENQEKAKNRRLNYSPWFSISINRPGDEPYIPALQTLRDRLEELQWDLRERMGEEK